MLRAIPGIAALVAVGLLTSACVLKDPKVSTAAIPITATAHDAIMMIGSDGDTTLLNAPPSLCSNPRFGRPQGRARGGAVTVPCWDGS